MHNTVYCVAANEPEANSVLQHLRNLGFPASDISVVLPAHDSDTRNISLREDTIRGAETGGLVGGILGWLAGLTSLAIPGVGVFLATGPLISALGGAVAGGVVGGLAGGSGAVHPGLPHDVRKRIENRLKNGAILISVHSDDPVIRERAVRVFRAAGAEDIYYPDELAAA